MQRLTFVVGIKTKASLHYELCLPTGASSTCYAYWQWSSILANFFISVRNYFFNLEIANVFYYLEVKTSCRVSNLHQCSVCIERPVHVHMQKPTIGRLSFAGWCPIRGQPKHIVALNLNHTLRKSLCNIHFKQGVAIVKGNCEKNKVNFQSSCPPLWGYQGFFYCNVPGRGIRMDARSANFVKTITSVVSALMLFDKNRQFTLIIKGAYMWLQRKLDSQ